MAGYFCCLDYYQASAVECLSVGCLIGFGAPEIAVIHADDFSLGRDVELDEIGRIRDEDSIGIDDIYFDVA